MSSSFPRYAIMGSDALLQLSQAQEKTLDKLRQSGKPILPTEHRLLNRRDPFGILHQLSNTGTRPIYPADAAAHTGIPPQACTLVVPMISMKSIFRRRHVLSNAARIDDDGQFRLGKCGNLSQPAAGLLAKFLDERMALGEVSYYPTTEAFLAHEKNCGSTGGIAVVGQSNKHASKGMEANELKSLSRALAKANQHSRACHFPVITALSVTGMADGFLPENAPFSCNLADVTHTMRHARLLSDKQQRHIHHAHPALTSRREAAQALFDWYSGQRHAEFLNSADHTIVAQNSEFILYVNHKDHAPPHVHLVSLEDGINGARTGRFQLIQPAVDIEPFSVPMPYIRHDVHLNGNRPIESQSLKYTLPNDPAKFARALAFSNRHAQAGIAAWSNVFSHRAEPEFHIFSPPHHVMPPEQSSRMSLYTHEADTTEANQSSYPRVARDHGHDYSRTARRLAERYAKRFPDEDCESVSHHDKKGKTSHVGRVRANHRRSERTDRGPTA